MADKPKPHVYRVPRSHPVAGKLKPGEMMASKMKMMEPDDDEETYPMEEMLAEPGAAAPPTATKRKAKTPGEYLKRRREMV